MKSFAAAGAIPTMLDAIPHNMAKANGFVGMIDSPDAIGAKPDTIMPCYSVDGKAPSRRESGRIASGESAQTVRHRRILMEWPGPARYPMTMTENDTQTHFGYRDVPEDEKAGLVQGVFSSVASRYDVMNDLMSGGTHRIWKGAMIDWLAPRPGWRILDVAGGTGDIAFRMLSRLADRGETAEVTVCDLTEDMLREGRARSENGQFAEQLVWVTGDAMALPFEDSSFDAYTIAFGIRNVTRIEDALAEAFRVLKPGGRFLCLEFSAVTVPIAQKVYDTYSFNVIPRIGQMVAGDRDSYQYLVESIRRFPDQHRFGAMIEAAGFEQVKWRNLTGGVAALHSGWKL